MTLSIAWVRSVRDTEELIISTDSRLRMGCAWDCGPKIMMLPRSDAAICFAGDTDNAYPMMIQMANAIACHFKSRSRALDICVEKGHIIRVFNKMREQFTDLRPGQSNPDDPEAFFIFAGYSWAKSRFYIWLLHYDQNIRKFTFRRSSDWKGSNGKRLICLVGDYVDEAKDNIIERLRDKGKISSGGLDMEPFEVLRDMLRTDDYPLIGGAPQILKVYKHLNTRPYAVFWPDKKSNEVSLLGRPLLDYETIEYLVLDPDTLITEEMQCGKADS